MQKLGLNLNGTSLEPNQLHNNGLFKPFFAQPYRINNKKIKYIRNLSRDFHCGNQKANKRKEEGEEEERKGREKKEEDWSLCCIRRRKNEEEDRTSVVDSVLMYSIPVFSKMPISKKPFFDV